MPSVLHQSLKLYSSRSYVARAASTASKQKDTAVMYDQPPEPAPCAAAAADRIADCILIVGRLSSNKPSSNDTVLVYTGDRGGGRAARFAN
jgi:hypothetical protein